MPLKSLKIQKTENASHRTFEKFSIPVLVTTESEQVNFTRLNPLKMET
jgi:hypothetical protein